MDFSQWVCGVYWLKQRIRIGYPVSAILFCLVYMTRPEGIMCHFWLVAMSVFAIVDRAMASHSDMGWAILVPLGSINGGDTAISDGLAPILTMQTWIGNRFKPFGWNVHG